MSLCSSLDCKQPPFQHKAFNMGLPWCLPRGNPTSHGEDQEEWERLHHSNRTESRALNDQYSLWSWVWGLES